ncbi:MAG: thioredoxin domain-containing protein [Ignisphaera sp.]
MNKKLVLIIFGVVLVCIMISLWVLWKHKGIIPTTEETCLSQNNVFVVVYKGAKPAEVAFKILSQIIADILRTNSSGKFNVEYSLCYLELSELPSELGSKIKSQFDFFPVFIVRSKNMSNIEIPVVDILFDRYKDYYYISKPNITKYIYIYLAQYGYQYLNISGVYATIVTTRKPWVNASLTPVIGSINARYYIYIYEDVYCPHCAKMHIDVLPYLSKFIENNTVAIILKNLIVHEEARDIQSYLVALYINTRNADLIYSIMKSIYSELLNGLKPSLDYVRGLVLEKIKNEPNLTEYKSLAETIISLDSDEAVQYLIIGTPGIIIWDNKSSLGVVIIGFRSADDIIKVLNNLNEIQ